MKEEEAMANKTILIVDDDQDLVDVLTTVLESAGYRVESAADRSEGWSKAQQSPPDLAVIDVMMGSDVAGFQLTGDFRRDEKLKKVPIIMLTAINQKLPYGFSPDKDEEFIPVDRFLEKPVDPETLLKEVAALL